MSEPVASDIGGFYVCIPDATTTGDFDVKKLVGMQITPGTTLSDALAGMLLLGADEATVKSLSNASPVALIKARERITNPSTPPPPSTELRREAAQRIFRPARGSA